MGKVIRAALAAGFVLLVERSVNTWLDHRYQKRATARAAKTGFAAEK
ncbi:MAG: hypothetical protein WEA77_08200 [Hyphomonas sp.]